MTNEKIPVTFIQKRIEIYQKSLEYKVMYGEDRGEWLALSKTIEALEELIKDWRKHESKD